MAKTKNKLNLCGHYDVVILGAGPAGLNAAYQIARGGLKVALIEQKPKGLGGAQWINGVPAWMLERADSPKLSEFSPDIKLGPVFNIRAPFGNWAMRLKKNPTLELDMRALAKDLIEACKDEGVDFFWETKLIEAVCSKADRVTRIKTKCKLAGKTKSENIDFCAPLFIDVSGLAAVLRKVSPELAKHCKAVDRKDLCLAAQGVFDIKDASGCRDFIRKNKIKDGEAIGWVGGDGGFSLLRVHVELAHSKISILTGSIGLPQYRSGKRILNDFVKSQKWIGKNQFGGSRAIPLTRPYSHLVAPGLALLGDSACQVYSSHGSGIGIGMIAAKILAETVLAADKKNKDIGSVFSLWSYPLNFHREYGGLFAFSDAFRRLSQSLKLEETTQIFESGLLTETLVHAGLIQHGTNIPAKDLAGQLSAAIKNPALSFRVLSVLSRLPAILALAKTYPPSYDPSGVTLKAYDTAMNALINTVGKE